MNEQEESVSLPSPGVILLLLVPLFLVRWKAVWHSRGALYLKSKDPCLNKSAIEYGHDPEHHTLLF